jgi:hypothetical protein
MKCFRVLCLFAVGFFAFASAITTAPAQAIISGNYYEDIQSNGCNGGNVCLLVFSATPQNVFITDVSCLLIANGAPVYKVVLAVSDFAGGTLSTRRAEYFVPVGSTANVNAWTVRSKAGFLFGAGKWPQITVGTNGIVTSTDYFCKISGTFVVP